MNTLTAELQITDPDFNADLLAVKVENVLDEAQTIRGYGKVGYSEAMIIADMSDGVPVFLSVSRFDYNQTGAEGQTKYSADGESITYMNREKLWYGWLPLARM